MKRMKTAGLKTTSINFRFNIVMHNKYKHYRNPVRTAGLSCFHVHQPIQRLVENVISQVQT